MQSSAFSNPDIDQRTGYLISGYLCHVLTKEEEEELDDWISRSETNMQIFEALTEEQRVAEFQLWYRTVDTETQLQDLKLRLKAKKRRLLLRSTWLTVAAMIVGVLFVVVIAGLLNMRASKSGSVIADETLQPASTRATLTFENGSVIELKPGLDTVINHAIRVQAGTIEYFGHQSEQQTHLLRVPYGGKYALKLSDGTRVQLNAGSSIRYPVNFNDSIRKVIVSGETYFEVRSDERHPFVVATSNIEFKAIGTRFNIRNYSRENGVVATLLEGALVMTNGTGQQRIRPMQTIQVNNQSWNLKAEPDQILRPAWTEGEFRFRNMPLEEVMGEISRWYDAEIKYEDRINFHFNGTLERNLDIHEVLQLLEQTGHVHFKIEGRRIIVSE